MQLSVSILEVDPWEPLGIILQINIHKSASPQFTEKGYHSSSLWGKSWFRWELRSQSAVFQSTSKLQ